MKRQYRELPRLKFDDEEEEPVLDAAETKRRAALGAAQSAAHSDPSWVARMDAALERVARRVEFVTSDDLWEEVGREGMRGSNTSGLGDVFLRAAAAGLLVPTGEWRSSIRPETKSRGLRVWRSLLRRS